MRAFLAALADEATREPFARPENTSGTSLAWTGTDALA